MRVVHLLLVGETGGKKKQGTIEVDSFGKVYDVLLGVTGESRVGMIIGCRTGKTNGDRYGDVKGMVMGAAHTNSKGNRRLQTL